MRRRITGGPYTGPELKFWDQSYSLTLGTAAAVSGSLNQIPQGVTESTRVGRKVTIKTIELHGTMSSTFATLAAGDGTAALWLILDKQTNGAGPVTSDVITGTVLPHGLRNISNQERFVILKKWVMEMNPTAGVSAAYCDRSRPVNYYKRVNIPIEFSSTTGALSELRSNALFLMYGLSNSTFNGLITFIGNARLRYDDM